MRRHSKSRLGGRLVVAALLVAAGDLAGVWTAARSEVTGWWSGPLILVCAFGADDPQSLREILAVSGVALGGVFVISAPEVIQRRRRHC